MIIRKQRLRRRGRSRNTQIRRKIADRRINFMADCTHHRQTACRNRARKDFFIETPEIFHAPAAARNQQDVCATVAVEELDSLRKKHLRPLSLHRRGENADAQRRKPLKCNFDEILHRRSIGRSDDADAARNERQTLLAGGIEKPFRRKTFLHCFKLFLKRPGSERFQVAQSQLAFAARSIK